MRPGKAMNLTPEDQSKLEHLIDAACHQQPALKAPRELRSRVLAELERRAALPWWCKSFVHWPASIRMGFMLALLGIVQVTLHMSVWFDTRLDAARPMSRPVSWMQNFGAFIAFMQSLTDYLGSTLLHRIPTPLLYGGVLGILMIYAAFVGLSVAAYRTFYASR